MNKKDQISISEKANISQGYLSKVLSGKANPTIQTLSKIADAYGISLPKLIKKISFSQLKINSSNNQRKVLKAKENIPCAR